MPRCSTYNSLALLSNCTKPLLGRVTQQNGTYHGQLVQLIYNIYVRVRLLVCPVSLVAIVVVVVKGLALFG